MKLRQSGIFKALLKNTERSQCMEYKNTLERRILIFKTFLKKRIFKIAYLSLIATVPNSILNEIQKI